MKHWIIYGVGALCREKLLGSWCLFRQPAQCLRKTDMLAMHIVRALRLQTVLMRVLSVRIGIVDHQLQHGIGMHARAFQPRVDPAVAGPRGR